jgi:hypothetical protein
MNTTTAPGTTPDAARASGERRRTVRDTLSSAFGAVLGLAPHVLHHAGFIAGSALITGAGGSALFYALGLLLSVPMLRRLQRRFQTWRAPAIAVVVFSAVFAVTNLVIGPAISSAGERPSPPPTAPTQDHAQHHR